MKVQEAAAAAVETLRRNARVAEVFLEQRTAVELAARASGAARSERRRRGACLRRGGGGAAMAAAHVDDPSADDLAAAAAALMNGAWPVPAGGDPLELADAEVELAEEHGLHQWLTSVRELLSATHPGVRVSGVRWRQAVVVAREDGEPRRDLRDGLRVHVAVPGSPATVRWTASARDVAALGERAAPARVREEITGRLDLAGASAPAPVGRFPVLLGTEAAAMLVHEAIAHALESDATGSWLSEGSAVGATALTVFDEPGRADGAGAYRVDDEGEPPRRVVLLEGGRVGERLRDRAAAVREGTVTSGHGRRQSYRDLPLPRLACTVVEPGPSRREDLLSGIVRGVLVERFASGTVDTASGSLCLFAEEARLVEGGRPGLPVRGLVLHGTAAEWVAGLEGIADDLRFDGGATACSKGGQSVPVVTGSPSLLFAPMPVGGVGA